VNNRGWGVKTEKQEKLKPLPVDHRAYQTYRGRTVTEFDKFFLFPLFLILFMFTSFECGGVFQNLPAQGDQTR